MYISKLTPELITQFVSTNNLSNAHTLIIGVGEDSKGDVPLLISELNKLGITFFGGIFPRIISSDTQFTEGAILNWLPRSSSPHLFKNISNSKYEFSDIGLEPTPTGLKSTAWVLIDGLSGNVATFLSDFFEHSGNNVNYFGAGCGSLSLTAQPSVFTNEGFFGDAAIVYIMPKHISLGVRHGWGKLRGPFVATKTNKNIIEELNWENAYDIYKEVVEKDSGKKFSENEFIDISKSYPFGIYRKGKEDIVRDPILVNDDGALVCLGDIPENTPLYILRGNKETLLDAAQKCADNSLSTIEEESSNVMIVDCISRALYLEEDYINEMKAISDTTKKSTKINAEVEGMLTLGEISSYGGEGVLEFFNKTIVTGVY